VQTNPFHILIDTKSYQYYQLLCFTSNSYNYCCNVVFLFPNFADTYCRYHGTRSVSN